MERNFPPLYPLAKACPLIRIEYVAVNSFCKSGEVSSPSLSFRCYSPTWSYLLPMALIDYLNKQNYSLVSFSEAQATYFFWPPLIHLSIASLSNRQTLPMRIAGILPSPAYLHMVISCSFKYLASSLVVIISGITHSLSLGFFT